MSKFIWALGIVVLLPTFITAQPASSPTAVQQSRQRYDEFAKRTHIDVMLPSSAALQANPFIYEGKVVGVMILFEQMLTKDRGLFDGDMLVSGIPPGLLKQRAFVLLAGRVLGKESVAVPTGGTRQLTHLKYEGIHICQGDGRTTCNEVLLWQNR